LILKEKNFEICYSLQPGTVQLDDKQMNRAFIARPFGCVSSVLAW